MNYEDKLRLAKEALASDSYDKETIEYIFPKLRESEDEKIRKAIICGMNALKEQHKETFASIPINDCLDWLEKQGEKTEPIEGFNTEFERQISHLIASAINKENEYNWGYVKWAANALLNYAKHELEKQREQKPAWSEEDNKNLNSVKWIIENSENLNKVFETIDSPEYIKKYFIDWLKSIKPNHWKPSKEQMSMLLAVLNDSNNITAESVYIALKSLYNDLKKL